MSSIKPTGNEILDALERHYTRVTGFTGNEDFSAGKCLPPWEIIAMVGTDSPKLANWEATHATDCQYCRFHLESCREGIQDEQSDKIIALPLFEPPGAELALDYKEAGAPIQWEFLQDLVHHPWAELPFVRHFGLSVASDSGFESAFLIVVDNYSLLIIGGSTEALADLENRISVDIEDRSESIALIPVELSEIDALFPQELTMPHTCRCYEINVPAGHLSRVPFSINGLTDRPHQIEIQPAKLAARVDPVVRLVLLPATHKQFVNSCKRTPNLLEEAATQAFYLHTLWRQQLLGDKDVEVLAKQPWLTPELRLYKPDDYFPDG